MAIVRGPDLATPHRLPNRTVYQTAPFAKKPIPKSLINLRQHSEQQVQHA
jgi:hypothetical protein